MLMMDTEDSSDLEDSWAGENINLDASPENSSVCCSDSDSEETQTRRISTHHITHPPPPPPPPHVVIVPPRHSSPHFRRSSVFPAANPPTHRFPIYQQQQQQQQHHLTAAILAAAAAHRQRHVSPTPPHQTIAAAPKTEAAENAVIKSEPQDLAEDKLTSMPSPPSLMSVRNKRKLVHRFKLILFNLDLTACLRLLMRAILFLRHQHRHTSSL